MSGFAPLLRLAALGPATALSLVTSTAIAQGSAAPVLIGTSSALDARGYSKADRVASAALSDGMSRLAAISAQQGGSSMAYWPPQPDLADPVFNDQRIRDFLGKLPNWQLQGVRLTLDQPYISYRQPDLMPAFMRGLASAPASATVQPAAVFLPSRPTPAAPMVRNGQPDVFGSVAMAVSHTSLDRKWAGVSQAAVGRGVWNSIVATARTASRHQQVEMINAWVNRRMRFVDDRQSGDSWALPNQSLQRGAGDCEDYAIAKMKLLEAAGFDGRALFLVIARDLVRQADHAVLAVRIDQELLILDNMTDRVLPSSSVSDYRPIMSFNAYGRWTHGYRVTTPQPVQFAAR